MVSRLGLDQSESTYLRIAGDLRAKILAGKFGDEGRLPTTRELARRLRVHRNTVVAAYRKLEEWGFARGHVGRGTFASVPEAGDSEPAAGASLLSASRGGAASGSAHSRPTEEPRAGAAAGDPIAPPRAPGRADARTSPRTATPWRGVFSRAIEEGAVDRLSAIYSVGSREGAISFAGSFPAADLLPTRRFAAALARVLKSRSDRALAYGPAQGHLPLRTWIAAEMTRRGMPTTQDEILITNGSQQAIDLIARAFTDPGDVVLLENPTYSGAISSFQSFGARLLGLPLDRDGLLTGAISGPAVRGGAKLLYITPSFQNPTSGVLPGPRRLEILNEAAAANVLLVEDDWAGALRFEGEDPPTLRALDREGRVIYLSTFAKMLIPGLRVGWIAAARPIVERLTVLKQINDCCTSPLVQTALELFCREDGLDRHLPRVRAAYRERRDRMIAAMDREFPRSVSWTRPSGGLFLWVELPRGLEAAAVAAEAESRGVLVSPGDPFFISGVGPPSLRLTFASARPEQIDEGIRILGSVLKKQLAAAGRRGRRPAQESVPLV